MDNMNQGGQSTPNNDPDKTNIHMGGAPGNPSSSSGRSEDDRTRIETGRPSQPSQPAASAQVSTGGNPSASNTIPPRPTDALNKKSSSGVSTGAAIGGATAAGVAGVAAGAFFSDEIKAGVDSVKEQFAKLGGDEETITPGETKPDEPSATAGTDAAHPDAVNTGSKTDSVGQSPASESEAANSISGTFTDDNGTIYKVELLDNDGDGSFDKQTLDIATVDGDRLHVVSNGGNFGDLFAGLSEPAEPQDYIQTGGYAINTGFGEASIPDLNIEDVSIPEPEVITEWGDGPEMIDDENSDAMFVVDEVEELAPSSILLSGDDYLVNGTETDFTVPIEDSSFDSSASVEAVEFDTVEWAEFDQPIESQTNEEYDNLLQQTDFNAEDYNFDSGENMTDTDYGVADFL
jgi:hypothetical protein